MEKTIINAKKREVIGKKVKVLRREGKLPAVIYGYGVEPTAIVLDFKNSSRTLAKAEASTLITIALDGEEYTTLVREKQWNYIRRELLHVDFQAVSMTELIASQVRIKFVGEASAANAVIVTGLNELEVEALPMDLPESIEVDLSVLKNIGDGIFVRDVVVGDKLTILDDPDAMVVVASAMAAEIVEEGDMAELLEGEEGEEGEEEEGEEE